MKHKDADRLQNEIMEEYRKQCSKPDESWNAGFTAALYLVLDKIRALSGVKEILPAGKSTVDEAVKLVLATMRTMESSSRSQGASWEDNIGAAMAVAELAKALKVLLDGNDGE